MNTPIPPPEDGTEPADPPTDDVLAGEFVLGVLDTVQRRRLQARLQGDPDFARRVAQWEARLAPLLTDIEPVEAPPRIWSAIGARLGWTQREPDSAAERLGRRLGFWRSVGIVASLVALAAIGFIIQRSLPPTRLVQGQAEPAAIPVTPLEHADGTPGWLASVNAAKGTVLMVPVPAPPDARGRVPELWLIPAGRSPISLGAVSINRSHTVTVPQQARLALVAGSTLAITLEPPTGIPHAAPSSAVIAKGTI